MIIRSNAPYIHTERNAPFFYFNMIVALMPCVVYAVFTYGLSAAVIIMASAAISLLISRISDRIRHISQREYYDLSAVVNGIILALLMPSGIGIIWVLIGVVFAEIIFKQFFGGVGSNPVNTALASVLMLNLAFKENIEGYLIPMQNRLSIESLWSMKSEGAMDVVSELSFPEIISGNYAGLLGVSPAIPILIGFVYLAVKKMIRIEAPLTYIAVISLIKIITGHINIFSYSGLREFCIFIVSSGVLFVAAFLLTDLTGVAQGRNAGFVSGILCGLIAGMLLSRSGIVVFICVPVLMTNIAAFLIDYIVESCVKRGDAL